MLMQLLVGVERQQAQGIPFTPAHLEVLARIQANMGALAQPFAQQPVQAAQVFPQQPVQVAQQQAQAGNLLTKLK